ncbi:MAG: hypothetical protein FWF44_07065 [Defluviitaleaceae bacterium]|nr:hypothetical protein [Defluviitaleaceae bacterium]
MEKWNEILSKAADFPGPLYIYDLDMITERVNRIKRAFPDFHLLYSLKANPHPAIVALMGKNGVGADTASAKETELAAGQGVGRGGIYYSSPGKMKSDLLAAMDKCTIIADSPNELNLLNSIARERGVHLTVGARLNIPNSLMSESSHEVMGGVATKFGIELSDFMPLDFGRFENLDIAGIHVYFGSQLSDPAMILNNFRVIAAAALEIGKRHPLKFVNFGGGFGVPQSPGEKELELTELSERIHNDTGVRELLGIKVTCNLELGRYLVAESGLFVTRVADVKESFGTKYVIIDGGMNTFYRPVMTGDFHGVIQPGNEREQEPITLVGNLCTPIDQYYAEIMMKTPEAGDLIAFRNAGAYGYSMSLLEFISREKPKEIIIGG